MRISLAYAFVTIAFIALALGWYASEQRNVELKRIHAEELDETLGGISTSSQALTRTFLAEALNTHDAGQYKRRVENDLIWSVYKLSSGEEMVDKAQGEQGYACYLAQRILRVVDCDSTAAFAAFARENLGKDPDIVESFPEYYDESSDEYKELAKFVQRSLDNEFVPSWARD